MPHRKLAYTSVMTTMNIMVRKGYLSRDKQGLRYVYRPLVRKTTTVGNILRDVMERVFDGSPSGLIISLLESNDISHMEINKLRQIFALRAESGKE